MNIVLRKSLLAVSIAMALSSVAMAESPVNNNLTLNGGSDYSNMNGSLEASGAAFNSVRVQGIYSGTADGVTLNSVNVTNDIVNEAAITSDDFTGANAPGAFQVGSVDLNSTMLGAPSKVGGSIINTGLLVAHGIGSSGMTVRNTKVGEDVINAGEIRITARNQQSPARGLDLNRATVGGKVVNTGNINLQGWRGVGINLGNGTSVAGDVTNAALVSVYGTEVDGVHVENSTIGGDLVNTGVVLASGQKAQAFDFDSGANLQAFVNRGSAQAMGEGSVAVLVDGATMTKGIQNYGGIQSDDIGISVEGFELTPDAADISSNFQIDNYGLIRAVTAIDGHEHTDLNWKEGTIDGNLLGLSKVNVEGDAKFYGSRIEANQGVHIASGGTLTLDQVTTSLDGDLTVYTGGTLGLPISKATTDTEILNVDGTAKFESGSNVVVNAQGEDFINGGREYRLLKANALQNEGLGISSSSAVLDVRAVRTNETEVFVTVAPKQTAAVKDVIASGGGNANAQRAGSEFVNAASELAINNPNDPVLAALMAAGTDANEVARLAKQLSPEVGVGATKAALTGQNMVATAVGTRMNGVRQGMSSGEGFSEVGAWFQVLNNDSNQDKRDGIEGYDANAKGFTLGADGKPTENTVLGVTYSYIDTDVDSDDGNKTKVETNAITGYGSWTSGQFFVDSSLTYGKSRNHSKRFIAGTEAKGTYDSDLFGVNVLAGYVFDIGHSMVIEPRASARYSVVNIDGFTEKGSSAALKSGDQRMEVGELGAGVRLAGQFPVAGGILEPEIKAMAYHDLIADESNTTSVYALGGNSFVTNGASASRDSYELGLAASYRRGAVTVGLGYDRLTKSGFESDTLTAKVRYDF